MEIIRNAGVLGKNYPKPVVAIGNFDGIHRGHQQLIISTVKRAHSLGGTAVVLTFQPHPLHVLKPERSLKLLISQQRKELLLQQLGVDVLFLMSFTLSLASMSPEDFVQKILVEEMGVNHVFVGYNYSFGKGGKGTPEMLASFGKQYNFDVTVLPPVEIDGVPVSSTAVRAALKKGDLELAGKYLGYRPLLEGKVVPGDGRGRKLGFPTANVALDPSLVMPPKGVYAAKVRVGNCIYDGVVNLGQKPTFGMRELILEVHLLDFSEDIYDRYIEVYFIRKLREEKCFSGVEELIEQVERDKGLAREILSQVPEPKILDYAETESGEELFR